MYPESGEQIKDYKVNLARVVIGRASIVRARPEIESWGCLLELEVDLDFTNSRQVGGASKYIGEGQRSGRLPAKTKRFLRPLQSTAYGEDYMRGNPLTREDYLMDPTTPETIRDSKI